MSKDTPAPPDYVGAAQAQAAGSEATTEQQTYANRPNTNTPLGSQAWTTTPTWDPTTGQYVNQWTQNTTLTPDAQAALTSQMDIGKQKSALAQQNIPQVQKALGSPLDLSGATPLAQTPGQSPIQGQIDTSNLAQINQHPEDYNQKAMDAVYGQWSNRMEPQFQDQSGQLDTQLQNQGLKPGDQAYDKAMKQLSIQQNDARTNAQFGATTQGLQEAQQLQGMDLGAEQQQFTQNQGKGAFANTAATQSLGQNLSLAGYQDQLHQQQISDIESQREMPLNEMNSILNGTQVQMPGAANFSNAGAAQAPNLLSAAQSSYGAALDASNAANQQTASTEMGVGSLAAMAALYF